MRGVFLGVLGAASVGAAVTFGCGGDGNGGTANAKLPEGVRSQSIEHEACSEGGHRVEQVDVNNDGKPDIKRVYEGDREVCRISDLNRDGKPDMFEYYDTAGNLRRREADYDDNGVVNSIEIYENGKIVRAELDATSQGRIDTWDTFEGGKRTKRERDTNGDGRVDQWWTYDGEKVTIASDKNGDGKPDPDSIVTLGGSAGAAAPPAAAGPPDGGLPPPPAPPSAPGSEPAPPSPSPAAVPDAGPPKRGGAKR